MKIYGFDVKFISFNCLEFVMIIDHWLMVLKSPILFSIERMKVEQKIRTIDTATMFS